jgi:hypothetical protein
MCDNAVHEAEREEARDARRFNDYGPARCYRHHYVTDGAGGGVCTGCGDTVSAELTDPEDCV